MEGRALYLQLGGLAVAAAVWIWLIARVVRQRRAWRLATLGRSAGEPAEVTEANRDRQ
jgi:hypothetical protein